MRIKLASALGAAILLASTASPALADRNNNNNAAAAATAPIVPGLGIANIEAIKANSNAFRAAEEQRTRDYAGIIQQAQTRAQQLQAQLQPLADGIRRDQALPNANQAAIQQRIAAFQQLQQNGEQEIQRITLPIEMSKAYVDEQISEQLATAIDQAVAERHISLLIPPDIILHADNAYNMNQAILDKLNALLPSVQLVPPPGWVPRQIREQQAAAAAANGQPAVPAAPATPAAPAGPLPEGR